MGLFGIGKKFNNNTYGIDKKTEWKGTDGLKEQLKETGLFTKKDIKEIKKAIKNDQLGAYMDNMGTEMRNALGLQLSGKVDDLSEAQRIAKGVDLQGADLDKVLRYIENAKATPSNSEITINTMGDELAGEKAIKTGNPGVDFYGQVRPNIDEKFMELLA